MFNPFARVTRRSVALLAASAALLAGCDGGPNDPTSYAAVEVAVVVNSGDRSLTVIPVENPTGRFAVGVGPTGSPVTVAARGGVAVVPMGTYPFAVVVDLRTRQVAHTVALPTGSGATGVAFLNDSIALVANSNLNSVTPVNVRRGTAGAQIAVGVYPQAIVERDGRAYVLNAELEGWTPARPGTVTVIDGSLVVLGTVQLTGFNPGAATFGRDGRLYVVNQGSWGQNNGSLSVVEVGSRREISHHTGFGDFPGAIAAGGDGRIMVGVYGTGILAWDPTTRQFARGPENPLRPGAVPPVSGLGFDSTGRMHVLNPGECRDPGVAYHMGTGDQVAAQTATGICPFGLAFTRIPAS